MSIKIKASYTDEGEKRLILKLLRPLLEKGYRCKEPDYQLPPQRLHRQPCQQYLYTA